MRNLFKIVCLLLILKQTFFYKFKANANATPEQCMGKHQIPLQLKTDFDIIRQPFEHIGLENFNVSPQKTILKNNGNTIVIEMKFNEDMVPYIDMASIAGLGIYRFEFLYFQWYEKASEKYNFKNISLPAELHAVFYDAKCKSFEEAMQLKKLILVLAFGLEVFPMSSDNLSPLENNLKNVRNPNTQVAIENVRLDTWLSNYMKEFYLYDGSMMIFNCKVPVVWLDFKNTITVKPKLVNEFHHLKSSDGKPLMQQFISKLEPANKILKNVYESHEVDPDENFSGIPFVDAYNHKNNPSSSYSVMAAFEQQRTIEKDENYENVTELPGNSIAFVDARSLVEKDTTSILFLLLWPVYISLNHAY